MKPAAFPRLTVLLAALFSLAAIAASAPAQSPEKILKQAVRAMTNGKGEKVLREIRSWQVKGTITDKKDGASGGYTAAALQPNLYASAYDIRGLEFSAGYNGKSGWIRDSRNGLRTLTGPSSRDFQAEALYRNSRWLDYKRDKSKLSFAGQTAINGKPANTVVMTAPKGVKIKMHFDAASGLLIREELPADAVNRVFDYADHRLVDNVMEPHSIHVLTGDQQFEIKLDEIKHNPQLDRASFDFPKLSGEPLPDIPTLLKEVGENEDALEQLLDKYTYTETIGKREIDPAGQVRETESETYDLSFYNGNRIRRLVAKNGKALTASEEADENKRVEKHIHDIEKKEAEKAKKAAKAREAPKESSGAAGDDDDERITIADVLRASRLANPRRERFRGREVIVFDFEPLPGYKPKKDYEKLFGKMAGAIWVDAADKQVARVEARLVEAYKVGGGLVASLKEGGSFVLEQDRINNEIWLPTRADINLGVKVLLVKGININQTIAYGNYKRFNVEAEKEKLKDPAQAEKPLKP